MFTELKLRKLTNGYNGVIKNSTSTLQNFKKYSMVEERLGTSLGYSSRNFDSVHMWQ